MNINYSDKVIDLIEENKKFISNKNKPVTIEQEPLEKQVIEVKDVKNINAQIKKDAIAKEESLAAPHKSLNPYKETPDLNLKYLKAQDKENTEVANLELIPTLDKAKIITQNTDKITNPLNTGVAVIDGVGDGLTGAVNSLLDYGEQISNGFSNSSTPKGLVDNYALYEKKSDIKKTVDLSTINTIPYVIDDTIKQFQSGSALNSIISGVIGTVSNVAELAGSFYDADEVLQMATTNYNQITSGGKLFSGDGIFGYNPTVGGNRPQIKIKKKTEDGKGYKTESFGVPEIKDLENRNDIGFLYVRPFKNKIPVNPFNIPFQTNPKISEDTIQANYASEQFLNRVGDIKTFINTSGQTLSLETSYMILSDETDIAASLNSSKRNNRVYSNWMEQWTPSYVQSIENAYRSLVYSTFYQGLDDTSKENTSSGGLWGVLKPPSVRIIMSSNGIASFSNELYSYPKARWTYQASDKTNYYSEESITKYNSTLKRLKADETIEDSYKWNKTFVVTGVQISRDDDAVMNKASDGKLHYTGFKVNITLSEITENYLDCIPDFASYYNSFAGDLETGHQTALGRSYTGSTSQNSIGEGLSDTYLNPRTTFISEDLNTSQLNQSNSNMFNTIDTSTSGSSYNITNTTNSIMEIQ